jgi:hypothetical protein
VNQRTRAEGAIRTPDQRLRVFVSSTLGELAEERQAVKRAVSSLRLTPVLFEAGARPHPPRAALLVGAAEGLRRRVGLRAWPSHRRGEAELVAKVRQALGADRFDQVFNAGSRLNRRQAVAAARDRRRGTAAS